MGYQSINDTLFMVPLVAPDTETRHAAIRCNPEADVSDVSYFIDDVILEPVSSVRLQLLYGHQQLPRTVGWL